jgi:cytochrome c biogenesis protein CcmG/thiol:disulfide interchange protein DsbE
MRGVRWSLWVLAAFAALLGLFALQLSRPKNDTVESTMIGQVMPQFALPAAIEQRPGLTSADLADGTPHLLNVFASWCVPCAAEAPQLAELERRGAPIVAVAVRDRPEDLAAFFTRYGNPFSRIGADNVRTVQLLIGSSGVPETFVVDGKGVIRHQHIGEIRPEDVPDLLARLRDAKR